MFSRHLFYQCIDIFKRDCFFMPYDSPVNIIQCCLDGKDSGHDTHIKARHAVCELGVWSLDATFSAIAAYYHLLPSSLSWQGWLLGMAVVSVACGPPWFSRLV